MSTDAARCPECRARIRPHTTHCWLCGRDLQRNGYPEPGGDFEPGVPANPFASPAATLDEELRQFPLSSISVFVILCAGFLGLSLIAPGIAIPLGILVMIAYIRTMMVVRARERRGATTSLSSRIGMGLSSLMTVVIVLVVTGVAAFAAFFATCLAAWSPRSGGQSVEFYASAAALIVAVGVLALFSTWIRRRWKRDVEKLEP